MTIHKIKQSNGKIYSIRSDRSKYFFPNDWENFYKTIKNKKHKLLFNVLLMTGARIMEAVHLKPKNFDYNRKTITFEVIKHRTAKKNFYATGKTRTFQISEKLLRQVKSYVNNNKLDQDEFLFMKNKEFPLNYFSLTNPEKKKYYWKYTESYRRLFKRKLELAKTIDREYLSLHNIRKTYGNWMRVFDIPMAELCYRMGHDINTYMSNYGSSLIFTPQERRKIMGLIG